MSYARFAAMIAVSTVVMFGLMYLNTYAIEHARFSETRAFMALVMGATMAGIMLLFMLKMYPDRRINLAILAGSVVVFAGALTLVRSQQTVGDVAYMKAMKREIGEMEALIEDLERQPTPKGAPVLAPAA